jgi:LmbE family N-acetylglucosaminyl deacetylase
MGGALAHYVAAGAEAMVVSATRGEAGQVRDAAVATRRTLGEVRERELRAACAVLGAQHVRFLGYHDGCLADLEPEVLAADVRAVLDEFQPDVVVSFGDDGAYGHPDHVAISRATTAAFLAEPRGRLYHSHFPRSRLLILERLAEWLLASDFQFKGGTDFVRAFSLFTEESTTMGFASDHIRVSWFPPGVYIFEQGETASSMCLILSGEVDIVEEDERGDRRQLRTMGAGQFIGEVGVARTHVRTAHAIARDGVTCLVLEPGRPTAFSPRGDNQVLPGFEGGADVPDGAAATTVIDVTGVITRKVEGIAAHRSQYPIDPDMFPPDLLVEMMGREYFVRIYPPVTLETDLLGG